MNRTRSGQPGDAARLAVLRNELWPDGSVQEHAKELQPILAGTPPGTLPYAIFVCETEDGTLIGFAEVGLRSHADGCDPAHPVGFLEGWFVTEEYRRQGVGAALVNAAEEWARSLGCREMASDTWLDSEISTRAHEALRFEIVDRCIHFRKTL